MKLLSIMIPSKKEFDSTINKILQGSEYKHLKNSVLDFIEKIKAELIQGIKKIISNSVSKISSQDAISDNLANIFIIIGLLLIFTIVVLIIIKVSKTFERKTRIKEILGEKIHDKTTPSSLRYTAASFGVEGDFRQAIRYEFIAILLLMHEKNVLYLDETKTNEEIYKYLKKNKFSMLSVFESLINDFNSSWYGHRECNEENYEKVKLDINMLWNEVLAYEEKS